MECHLLEEFKEFKALLQDFQKQAEEFTIEYRTEEELFKQDYEQDSHFNREKLTVTEIIKPTATEYLKLKSLGFKVQSVLERGKEQGQNELKCLALPWKVFGKLRQKGPQRDTQIGKLKVKHNKIWDRRKRSRIKIQFILFGLRALLV